MDNAVHKKENLFLLLVNTFFFIILFTAITYLICFHSFRSEIELLLEMTDAYLTWSYYEKLHKFFPSKLLCGIATICLVALSAFLAFHCV